MKTILKVVTLTPSARWRSAVQCHLTEAIAGVRIEAALDFEDCLTEVERLHPVAAIVELDRNRLPTICSTLGQRSSGFSGTIFIAIGDQDLLPWLSLLRISGFADVCCEVAGLGNMCERIKRHAETGKSKQADAKLESVILDQLPWKTIRNRDET